MTTAIPKTMPKPIVITTGEPAGIGMDIVIDLAKKGYFASLPQPIIVTACERAMTERLQTLQSFKKELPSPWEVRRETVKHCFTRSQDKGYACVGEGDTTNDSKNKTEMGVHKVNWQTLDDIEQIYSNSNAKLNNKSNTKPNNNSCDFYLLNITTAEPVVAGKINISNAPMVLKQLEVAHKLAIDNKVTGIVTAPLQKSALIDANLTLPDGTMFSGHTEYFMQMSHCNKVVMMLANRKLKVALVTTHLPLSEVANAITKDEVRQTVQIVLDSLHSQFHIANPKVLVCGLNPHAGEGGHLGMEEIEIINPVLQSFIDKGHDISLAMPADTLFTERYLNDCDATIAMYHDQGLPVLKSHGFGDSVNLTLGLPYIRTSVDHGTALDLAGCGTASSDSLRQAVQMLVEMSG